MKENFEEIKNLVKKEKQIIREMKIFFKDLRVAKNSEEGRVIRLELNDLRGELRKTNNQIKEKLEKISLIKPLEKQTEFEFSKEPVSKRKGVIHKEREFRLKNIADVDEFKLSEIEKSTLERLKKREKKREIVKIRKPSSYLKLSNKIFINVSSDLIKEPFFNGMRKDIIKSNLEILPRTYVSMMLLTTIISFIVAIFVILFFLFFNVGIEVPFITLSIDAVGLRFIKIFWMLIVFPLITFFFLYFYPSLERRSNQSKIDQEIPFATIHMSAVSGSMIDPTRIFSILIMTRDYPNISKQFTKLLNQINLQGYSLVNALRITAFNGPSNKLSELLNGLATTITSGGDLPEFFEKRAESLMLEYRLEKEKYAKTAETFMDIYISVVIAAPMILMLLLIMMQISGIGIGLSSGMISVVMSLGVSLINFAFLVFLHLRSTAIGE